MITNDYCMNMLAALTRDFKSAHDHVSIAIGNLKCQKFRTDLLSHRDRIQDFKQQSELANLLMAAHDNHSDFPDWFITNKEFCDFVKKSNILDNFDWDEKSSFRENFRKKLRAMVKLITNMCASPMPDLYRIASAVSSLILTYGRGYRKDYPHIRGYLLEVRLFCLGFIRNGATAFAEAVYDHARDSLVKMCYRVKDGHSHWSLKTVLSFVKKIHSIPPSCESDMRELVESHFQMRIWYCDEVYSANGRFLESVMGVFSNFWEHLLNELYEDTGRHDCCRGRRREDPVWLSYRLNDCVMFPSKNMWMLMDSAEAGLLRQFDPDRLLKFARSAMKFKDNFGINGQLLQAHMTLSRPGGNFLMKLLWWVFYDYGKYLI